MAQAVVGWRDGLQWSGALTEGYAVRAERLTFDEGGRWRATATERRPDGSAGRTAVIADCETREEAKQMTEAFLQYMERPALEPLA